jgi:predicted helicase
MADHKKCKVYHADLWGLRQDKYARLLENDIKTIGWREIEPKSEFYFFIPRNEALEDVYKKYTKITDIFPVNSVGVVTARDNLTIKWAADEVWQTVLNFSKQDSELARKAYNLGNDVRDWKVKLAQQDLLESSLDKEKIVPILYRPFDIRYTYYTGKSRGFICMPRPEIMRHMLAGDNLGLLICRQQNKVGFFHAFVSKNITESCAVSNKTREISYLFPLYLYPETDKKHLFSHLPEHKERNPNISPKLMDALCRGVLMNAPNTGVTKNGRYDITPLQITTNYTPQQTNNTPTPEEIFHYIYAVLYSNTYRTKYAEFLKTDFPHVPFTNSYELFLSMGELGKRLVDLHLLKSPELDTPSARFQGQGDNKVDKPIYQDNRVYINKDQYFEGITPQVWEYQIGGYQVLYKWLKDRKNRTLSLAEIKIYCRIATALAKTIVIQTDIDKIYPAIEQHLL